MAKKRYARHFFEIDGQSVPVRIFREWRRSISFSITNSAVVVRVPVTVRKKQLQSLLVECRDRTIRYFEKHPKLRQRFIRRQYQDGDTLTVGDRAYTLSITEEDRKTDGGKIQQGHIYLKLSQHPPAETRSGRIRKLLSRLVAKDQLPVVSRRVHELNALHFQQEIHDVRLKYNHSNWGSCSSNGRINLSTRLLFAPQAVIDYVIIHELAHLIELNHSPAFWQLVEKAEPNYREYVNWLKKNGAECDF